MARVVLVTGVSRFLAARFASTLAQAADVSVIGVDVVPPAYDLGEVSFVRADIRNPGIAKVIGLRGVDTVVHLAVVPSPSRAGGRSGAKETNVLATLQLLAACQRSDSFAKLVVRSSAAVYGASPRDPARFTEDMSSSERPRTGFGQDSVEIESYVRGLARRRPDVTVTTLRLAALMGAQVDSPITRYLSLPVVPKVMGFDARLQFLHPSDAVSALLRVAREDLPGTFNVGADDIVTLSQAIAMLGRPPVGVPRQLAPTLAGLLRQAGLVDFTADQIDALTYGRAMDTTRFAEATGFRPAHSSRDAVAEFAELSGPGLLSAERLEPLLDSLSSRLTSGRRGRG